MEAQSIAGYTFGTRAVEPSPVTAEDVELLKAALLWSDEDDRYLRMAGAVLADQVQVLSQPSAPRFKIAPRGRRT